MAKRTTGQPKTAKRKTANRKTAKRTAKKSVAAPGEPTLPDVLAARRVVLCLGSGGVGKTTTSAALAFALAANGERVVVLTIDPARRLADALGLDGSVGNEAVRLNVGRKVGAGEVWAAMLDPTETFEQIIRSEAEDDAQAERVITNRLFRNLTSSLSGTNEYMAAERLLQLHNDERFDRVIVDTPPSRHAIDFLDSPGRLARFVDHRLYRSVFAPKHSLLRPLNAGGQIIMRLLGRLVGSSLVDEVISFFSDFEGMDQGFQRRAREVGAVLTGPEAAYVLVAGPRQDRLAEAEWIAQNVARRDLAITAVVVNRVLPIGADETRTAIDGAKGPLRQNLEELVVLADQEAGLIEKLRQLGHQSADRGDEHGSADGQDAVPVFTIAEQARPVASIAGLADLARLLGSARVEG